MVKQRKMGAALKFNYHVNLQTDVPQPFPCLKDSYLLFYGRPASPTENRRINPPA